MEDAGVRRHHLEIAESLLAPAQEEVALAVALKLQLGVVAEAQRRCRILHLHGVVDDQLGGLQRVDAFGVAAQFDDGVAHGGQIDDGRHAGEVLHQHPGRHEGDLLGRARPWHPIWPGPRCRRPARVWPSSLRSRFSRRIRSENGSLAACGTASAPQRGYDTCIVLSVNLGGWSGCRTCWPSSGPFMHNGPGAAATGIVGLAAVTGNESRL